MKTTHTHTHTHTHTNPHSHPHTLTHPHPHSHTCTHAQWIVSVSHVTEGNLQINIHKTCFTALHSGHTILF